MSKHDHLQGYHCEFKDSVREDFICKKCNLVARSLTVTICCGESFCHACIADAKPCPACGVEDYNIFGHVKNQRLISHLQIYCSMKERGCDWSGTLEQLDTHLDPDQDNCQYVDTKCPLNCHMTIPKNKVEQHVAQHCAKRPYVCQHCNFKATYEEVVDKHLPECRYVPLQCPNLCGVTFERDFMEDHMKMCRLQDVRCEFSGVGCGDRFIREDQEEHTRQNSQAHLTLTAFSTMETKEKLQKNLLKQDKKHKEEEAKLNQKIEELEKKLDEQEKKLDMQKLKLNEQTEYIKEVEDRLMEQQKSVQAKLSILATKLGFDTTYTMTGFSRVKAESKIWTSPAIYTHLYGYKFCVKVYANGVGGGCGKAVHVTLSSLPGMFDNQLKWPAKAGFTLELINQRGGENAVYSKDSVTMSRPTLHGELIAALGNMLYWGGNTGHSHFIKHSELGDYLVNDTLHFRISAVVL